MSKERSDKWGGENKRESLRGKKIEITSTVLRIRSVINW